MKKLQYRNFSLILFVAFSLVSLSSAWASELVVVAANSTCGPLKKAGEIFSRQQGVSVTYICKSSGVLVKGLESGYITGDYFISASRKWVDDLVAAGMMDPAMVKPLWANSLIAAAARTSPVELHDWDDLASAKVSTVILGDPSATPLGRQFKKAMVGRGLWLKIRSKIVAKRHMSLIKEALLTANDTTVGIMFPTSLDNRLKTVLAMPTTWHEPIQYYGGPIGSSTNKNGAALFASFLSSAEVNTIFREHGYVLVP